MDGLEGHLLELIASRDWKKIIQLSEHYSLTEKSRFLWAWPSEKCLLQLKNVLAENGVKSVLSIGCGSGLLEWLLEEMTGLPVSGIELKHSLWSSNYSPAKFIKVKFIVDEPSTEYLRESASTVDNFALLFCYFNNRSAFDKYIEAYDGNVVLIIGPRSDCNIVTDPLPLDPKFCGHNGFKWAVKAVININDYEDDCNILAVYRRD
ncbi:uncharacterized protein LOC119076149 [Bradysia coprophila]|uniref:uncharacterized protein LOC119076149 n=1 Tax=Bradysia coprophila TaxID=38358 RepID=UPI00187D7C0D|nr:uncharacterized protein LOC119076149 [Bradysia coprophila]